MKRCDIPGEWESEWIRKHSGRISRQRCIKMKGFNLMNRNPGLEFYTSVGSLSMEAMLQALGYKEDV